MCLSLSRWNSFHGSDLKLAPRIVTESGLAALHSKISTWVRQMLVEGKIAFNQNADNLGRWWIHCYPKTISEDSAQPEKFLEGKREIITVNHWDGRRRRHHICWHLPLCAGLWKGLLTSVIFLQMLCFILNFLFCIGLELINTVVIVSGEQGRDSAIHIHVPILCQIPLPSGLPHNSEQSCLCYTVGPCWLPILNIALCTCPFQTP